jgi:hypothetical protein
MKIHVEIDCTPDEARQFFGLPDLRPMQEAVMERMQQRMLDAIAASGPEALLKAWMPLVPQTSEQMRVAMAQMFAAFTPPGMGSGGGGGGGTAATAGGGAPAQRRE